MSPRVRLYLDIDGVLNAYVRHALPEYQSHWEGGYRPHAEDSHVFIAPGMVEALNRLVAEHGIICHWLTTWEHEAPAFGESIGLAGSRDWTVLPALSGRGADWPKFTSIRDHVQGTRPDVAIWIDDDLATEPDARAWAAEHRVLAIAPSPLHGIEPRHIEEARRLIHTASADARLEELAATLRNRPTRDPGRIDGVLDAVRLAWKDKPDLRLAQLIEASGASFYTEDDELVERLLGTWRPRA